LEGAVLGLPRALLNAGLKLYGVRHFSPAASYHLLNLLNEVKPKCVLIEGPEDANPIIRQLAEKNVRAPVAILGYTKQLPADSVIYPFAEYSPEYAAIVWAVKNNADVRFIDLPTGITLALRELKENEVDKKQDYYDYVSGVYSEIARINGENDYDSYWERNFEHNLNAGAYIKTVPLHSAEIRKLTEEKEAALFPREFARTVIREAYMKRRVTDALSLFGEHETVVITGAYHTSAIRGCPPANDAEIAALPIRETAVTLMPYSAYRLSNRSGYGAGNKAPEYFQLMWEMIRKNKLADLPNEYAARLGRYIREEGGYCPTSDIIELVRLANALTGLKGGSLPVLADLHSAAIACVGRGDSSGIVNAFASLDIGTRMGELPDGVSQTPIQDDMNREIKRLKLDKYKTVTAQKLELDLRENIRVKSEEAAFLDLNRSIFFNRLKLLGIGFASEQSVSQDKATWKEIWELRWSPEVEMKAVEAVLLGETVEIACAYKLREELQNCCDPQRTARLTAIAYKCDLTESFSLAASALENLAAETDSFIKTANTAFELSRLVRYGDLRRADVKPLMPLLGKFFLKAALLLNDCAGCDGNAANEAAVSMNLMHAVSQENFGIIDDDIWISELEKLAFSDDKNAKLSGLAFAVLLERNLVGDERCGVEISRRLSAGTPADIGASWFEGMSMRNRYALISRTALWRELDGYVAGLDNDEFRRSLVALRRAFSDFTPREKNSVAELICGFWGADSGTAAEIMLVELCADESALLDGLNDFDF